MAKEIFANSNSKKKKKDEDELFYRVASYALQKALMESRGEKPLASKAEPVGKTPTKPTVASTVGSHTNDYGKHSGSNVGKTSEEEPEKKWYQGWFDKGAFADGFEIMDVPKTILGTKQDITENVTQAVIDATENLVDVTAYGVGAVGSLFSKDFQNKTKDFIAKDLFKSKETAEWATKYLSGDILTPLVVGDDVEGASVLGDKSDGLVQSAAHLVGSTALQIVGVPWWLTQGVNSFAPELENAFANDATYGEAGLSAAITTGAELLTEKISSGIKFGKMGTLDDAITKPLARKISNKVVRTLLKSGIDVVGEGGEEILSNAISAVGQKLTYADDKKLSELFSYEDALDAFIGGAILGSGGNVVGAVNAHSKGVDAVSGLTSNEEAVVKKIYDDRVAEESKSGKLTLAQKNKIYDSIVEELKRDKISTEDAQTKQTTQDEVRQKPVADTPVQTAVEAPVQSRMQTTQTRLADGGTDALSNLTYRDIEVYNDFFTVEEEAIHNIFKDRVAEIAQDRKVTKKDKARIFDEIMQDVRSGAISTDGGNAQTTMSQQGQEVAKPNVMEAWQNQKAQEEKTEQLKDTLSSSATSTSADTVLRRAAQQAAELAKMKGATSSMTEMESLGTNGQRSYQKHIANAANAITFSNAFQRYYDAGHIGVPFESIKTAYDEAAPRSVLFEAYSAGQNDASSAVKDNPSTQKKVDKKGKKSPSRGKGRLYDNRTSEGKAASDGKTVTEKVIKVLEQFAKVFNVDIEVVDSITDSKGRSIANGYYANGKVVLAADSGNPLMTVLKHEVTHHIQHTSPAQYKAFKDYVMKAFYNNSQEDMNAEVQRRITLAKLNNLEMTRSEAMDEIVADATEQFLTDRDSIDALVKENRSLGETILNAIRDVLRKIEAAMKGVGLNGFSDFMDADQLKQAEKMWVEALASASMEDGVGIQYDGASESVAPIWSLKTWNESEYVKAREEAAKTMAKQLGITKEKALAYIDDINGIARLIADDQVRLDYDSNLDENATVLKPNSDYKFSVDMSTLCAKRLLFTGTFDAIQKAMPNTVFDSDDIVRLRKMMMDKNLEVACGICYVESTRREIGRITQDFIDRYKEAQKTGKPITRLNSEGKVVDLKKTKDQMDSTADKSTDKFFADKDYTPTLADLNTTDIDMVKRYHPLVYEAYLNFMNARGQAKPKLLETRAEYKGEILKHFKYKSAVKSRNEHGGLRLQSFSDFEVPHMIDMMQVIMDMSRVGLQSQAYTKVPAFAEVFGGTGVKINLSLIAKGDGLDSKGNLLFDDVEGMNHKEAFRLRDQYPNNVGTILVGKNDAHIIAAMADPRIDFIIPFHKSSWKESLYDALGLTGYSDYTDTQNEKPIDKDRKISNFDPSEYWDFTKTGDENAQIYLEKCREDGRVPKFPQFQGYPGYWKLLIDFKMYNNDGVGSPQTVVRPDFNMDAATKILNDYEGGHRSFPVAKDVVNEFVSEYKAQKNTTDDGGDGNPYQGKSLTADSEVYSYDFLVNLPDMEVNEMPSLSKVKTGNKVDQQKAIKLGMENAANVGREVTQSVCAITNRYTGREIHVSQNGLGHSLDAGNIGRLRTNARLAAIGGEVIMNAVPLNALRNTNPQAQGTYAMAALLRSGDRDVVAIVTVEQHTDRVTGIDYVDIAHSINGRLDAKKEGNRSSTRESGLSPATATFSVSIADFLGIVNNTHRSILSEDVLAHFGVTKSPDGYYSGETLFSLKSPATMETDLTALRQERGDLEEQIDMADLNGLSDAEIRKLNNRMTKVNAEIDKIVAEERRAVVKTPMQTILDNLGNYRRSDLESLAEQISEGAWDGYEDLSRTELEDALREEIESRELTTLEMQNKKFGLYVRPVEEQPQYQLKTPPELLEISQQIAEAEHKAKAVTDAEIMSQKLKSIAKTDEEMSVVRNYQNAMKKLADYEKELAVYDATKVEHSKGRSIYTDASGKVKKSGVKYSTAEKAEIQRKVELWKLRLREIEQKEAFKKVLKREKANMAERHAKEISDLRAKYDERLNTLRSQRDAKVETEKQRMRDYKQHQRDSKEYKALKAKLESDVKWLGDRLTSPTEAKHIPDEFRSLVAAFLENLDFTTKRMDANVAKTGKPSQKTLQMWELIEMYQEIAKGDGSDLVLTPIEEDALKLIKRTINGKKVEDLEYHELQTVYDVIRYIKMGVANANEAFNKEIKETISENGDAAIRELRNKKAKKTIVVTKPLDKLLNFDNVNPADKFHEFGGVLEKLYGEIRKGFNQHIENVRTATEFAQKLLDGHEEDIKKWSGKKATTTEFKMSDGTTIELTPAQVMSLYALMKRDQARTHIIGNKDVIGRGIVPSNVVVSKMKTFVTIKGKNINLPFNGIKVAEEIAVERASRCSPEDVQMILESLTDEQKRIADSIATFFTTKCAAWGNETSMRLFNIKKFTEKNYFPIQSSDAYLKSRFDESGDVLIKNISATKNTVVNANNPIVVDDIFDVFTDHVNKMSMYNALVVPLTDFTRVFNYKSESGDTVKAALQAAQGKLGVDYVTQFMKDVNKQANALASESLFNALISKFKKAKVGGNVRVFIQQPTSIVRATGIVDDKYIRKGLSLRKKQVAPAKEEMLMYSPIAYWKHNGHFQTDVSRSLREIIMDESNPLDKYTMDWYGKADDWTWACLWRAIKLEQADAHPDMDQTSSEFMELVANRFEEVVDRTQVVDSVFHKSQMMRANSTLPKMATSFMSEPIKTINYLRTELLDAIKMKDPKKASKVATKAITTYVKAAIVNAIFASFWDAFRDDDDEDEEGKKRGFLKKWGEAFISYNKDQKWYKRLSGNLVENLNPLSMIPVIKEVNSLWSGYSVNRMDMESISQMVKAASTWTNDKRSWPFKVKTTIAAIGDFTGTPVSNVMRDFYATVRTVSSWLGGWRLGEYWVEKCNYDISNPDNRSKFYKHYTDAVLAGDQKAADAILKDMVVSGIPYDNIIAKGYQAEKKVAFAKAKKLISKGKTDEAKGIVRELAKKYDKKYSTLWKSVKEEEPANVPEETYDFGDLQKAVRKGEDTDEIEDYLVESGEFSKEAMREAIKMLTEKYK